MLRRAGLLSWIGEIPFTGKIMPFIGRIKPFILIY